MRDFLLLLHPWCRLRRNCHGNTVAMRAASLSLVVTKRKIVNIVVGRQRNNYYQDASSPDAENRSVKQVSASFSYQSERYIEKRSEKQVFSSSSYQKGRCRERVSKASTCVIFIPEGGDIENRLRLHTRGGDIENRLRLHIRGRDIENRLVKQVFRRHLNRGGRWQLPKRRKG